MEQLWWQQSGVVPRLVRGGLWLPSLAFRMLARRRARAFDRGRRPITALPVPVISVGNLAAGGTGKTPVVAQVVARLRAAGHRPGVLARGYGPVVVTSDQPGGPLNDEGAELMARFGVDLPQVQEADRVAGGRRLLAAHPDVDVLVLDDGFQHRHLARQLDLVVLDAANPFGYGAALPRGLLREDPAALARADLVLLSRCERVDGPALDNVVAQVRRLTSAPLLQAQTVPTSVEIEGSRLGVAHLQGVEVDVACGIGNPAAFVHSLERAGAQVRDVRRSKDHRMLTDAQLQPRGDQPVLITRKDAVKLARLPLHVWVLDIEVEITHGGRDLDRALHGVFA